MSQYDPYQQPPVPPDLPPSAPYDTGFDYYAPRTDSAAKLVRLAVIFNYISAGLDLCLGLLAGGAATLFLMVPDIPRDPGDPPQALLAVVYVVLCVLSIGYAIVKFIGNGKMRRHDPGAWGWGLAMGIVGCAQIVGGSCICLQVAAGVYTVVIICFSNVKSYLAMPKEPLPQEGSDKAWPLQP